MPIDPQVIPPKPADPGTASALADLTRRVQQLESRSGVVGAGAHITGPVIATSDTGQRVVLQGPTEPGGAKLYLTDSGGIPVIQLIPGSGLLINAGASADATHVLPENISWMSGSSLAANTGASTDAITGHTIWSAYAFGTLTSEQSSIQLFSNDGLTCTGAMSATAFNVIPSEEHLKHSINDVRPEDHDGLLQLRVVNYRLYNDDSEYCGFLVDDVAEHLPAAIHTPAEPDADRGINLSSIVALLVAKVQDQDQRIQQLEAKLEGGHG